MLTRVIQISPYAAALNTTTCGPLDVKCICQSNTFIEAAQVDVPQACVVADQKPIFSYIEAACSDFGSFVSFSTTSVPIVQTTAQIATITTTVGLTNTPSAGASRSGIASSQGCAEPALSTGASAGLIVAAFAIGCIAAALGTIVLTRRSKSRGMQQDPIRSESTVWHDWGAPIMRHSQMKPVIIAEADTTPQRSELMGSKDNESL